MCIRDSAETGFGTGLNFFAVTTLFREFRQKHPDSPLKRLYFISFEKYPLPLDALKQAHLAYPQFSHLARHLQLHWLNPIPVSYTHLFPQRPRHHISSTFSRYCRIAFRKMALNIENQLVIYNHHYE